MENRFTGNAGCNRANWQRKPRGQQVTNNSTTPNMEPSHDHQAENGASGAQYRRSFYYYNSNSKGYNKYQHNPRKNGPQRRPYDQNFGPPRQSPARAEHQHTREDTATRHDNVTEIHVSIVARANKSVSQPETVAKIVKGQDKTRAQKKKAKSIIPKEVKESKKQRKIKAFNDFKEKYSHIQEAERPFFILPSGIVLAEPPILYTTDRSTLETKPDVSKLEFVALDCECVMGYVEPPKNKPASVLGRVSIVDGNLECIYDKFVKARTRIWAYNTPVSGIREEDMVNGEDFFTVQREVAQILNGKMLVGHSLNNDMNVLFLRHPNALRRDTAGYLPLRKYNNGKTPSLKTLAKNLLGLQIQSGEHDSTVDARTSMQLYQVLAKEWEASLDNQKEIDTKSKILMKETVWLEKPSYSRAECAHYKRLAQKQQEVSDENEPITNATETPARETKQNPSYRQRNKTKKPTEEPIRNGNRPNNSYLNGAAVNENDSVINTHAMERFTSKLERKLACVCPETMSSTLATEGAAEEDQDEVEAEASKSPIDNWLSMLSMPLENPGSDEGRKFEEEVQAERQSNSSNSSGHKFSCSKKIPVELPLSVDAVAIVQAAYDASNPCQCGVKMEFISVLPGPLGGCRIPSPKFTRKSPPASDTKDVGVIVKRDGSVHAAVTDFWLRELKNGVLCPGRFRKETSVRLSVETNGFSEGDIKRYCWDLDPRLSRKEQLRFIIKRAGAWSNFAPKYKILDIWS